MADWKRLSKALILADGQIDDRKVDIIRKEFLSDGTINKAEAEFLVELRNGAAKASQKFHEFVFEIVQKSLLADGEISAAEAAWLKKFLLADGKVDDLEKALLKRLQAAAKKTCLEFDALLAEHAP